MLYVGLDLSRKRLDWLALDQDGELAEMGAVTPDRDRPAKLGGRLGDAAVLAVIESMSGARFVHDQLELAGWEVRIADAQKARGLAPLACKTDRTDCWVLAELARRNSFPRSGCQDHRCGPSGSAPASACTWSSTAARSRTPRSATSAASQPAQELVGYSGLTPRVEQSGERDRRGSLRKNGPNYLRWALIEAAHTAGRDPRYRPIVERMRERHGRKRGSKVAAIEIGRRLSEAIWHMLTRDQPFAPAGAPTPVAA